MKAIYKYALQPVELQTLSLPMNAEILSVQNKDGHLFLWALSDVAETVEEDREIWFVGTGQKFSEREKYKFLETVMVGGYVWHVFVRYIP
jgi:hypothetical protein